jgi:diaminohydroxyphosphoribosylaminopyrimidine deaminase / 5-amino-6-(5-phosphoribosylamino)uracil reductase
MSVNEKYMLRCLELARLGAGNVAPNPMVGCVVVYGGKIIGEGFHQFFGGLHAEVNAINSVTNQELLKRSTLYVSLEPCSHFGKTPPCTDLILSKKIPEIVIGTIDPYGEVAGKGLEKLRRAGLNVAVGLLEPECRELNKRFFTFHEKKRPYIILKWAQTLDGFIDIRGKKQVGSPTWITRELARKLVHKIRSEEDAILVGTNTAEMDDPSLNVYNWSGRNPVRIVLDRLLRLPSTLKLFDNSSRTLVFNAKKTGTENSTEFIKIDFAKTIVPQILRELFLRQIQSVIVEGGKQLLDSFITENLWDEAHIFIGNKVFQKGIEAPRLTGPLVSETLLDTDWLKVFRNI